MVWGGREVPSCRGGGENLLHYVGRVGRMSSRVGVGWARNVRAGAVVVRELSGEVVLPVFRLALLPVRRSGAG